MFNKIHYRHALPRLFIFCALFYGQLSFAVFDLVYDPYDVVQNTITAKNSITALINQTQQLQYEVENLKKLSSQTFDDPTKFLQNLAQLASRGKALSYGLAHIDQIYDRVFPGCQITDDYPNDYQEWSSIAHDTLKQSLLTLSLQGNALNDESHVLRALHHASESVSGHLQAQQTTHRIGLQQINQLQKLRQLLLNQASSQSTYLAYQLQKEQSSQATLHAWIKQSHYPVKPYSGTTGFGANELPTFP